MAASSISPVAPARIGALLVPVGKLRKSKFESFVNRIQPENIVRLGDISPDQRPDRNTFSPLAFPNGVILYDLSTSQVPTVHQEFFPFELHKHQLVVLGILDGRSKALSVGADRDVPDHDVSLDLEQLRKHQVELESLFQHALTVQLLVFDHASKISVGNAITVPPKGQSRSTTMKTVMCDVSAKILAEMSVFAKSIQTESDLSAPTSGQGDGAHVPYLMRQTSLREAIAKQDGAGPAEPRISSSDPFQSRNLDEGDRNARRASTPTVATAFRDRSESPVPIDKSPPRGAPNAATDLKKRPKDSALSRIRDMSRNRSSIHGAPSMNTSERAKNLAKLRQGLVLGNLYLLAGRWPDALRELVDNTTRAKVFVDHLWFAKGLESILATMILLAWARIDFTIPTICFSAQERSVSLKHVPSSNLVRSSQSIDSNDGAASRTLSNLTMALPEIVNSIVQHYRRDDGVDNASLSQFPFSESVIRLAYMTAVLQRTGGQLTERTARYLVVGSPNAISSRHSQRSFGMHNLHNAEIAGLVFQAFPAELTATTMPIYDIISILSGIISVLSMARLYRKRAMIIREAMSMLIPRLIQARKVGAAEMGIHPAASLAAHHGLTIDSASGAPILGSGRKDIDFHDLLVVLCETFGVPGLKDLEQGGKTMLQKGDTSSTAVDNIKLEVQQRNFGGFELKQEILRLCANFSEAVPNFHDVVQFTSALLRVAGPGSAPAPDSSISPVQLPPEDQSRFVSKIDRTLGVFRSEDAAQLESEYWDPFLVRDITLIATTSPNVYKITGQLQQGNRIKGSTSDTVSSSTESAKAINSMAPSNTVIAEEQTEFVITLQNLYDFDVYVESLQVLAEGATLHSDPVACTIAPRALQQMSVRATAAEPGELRISTCRVKIQGCREQVFSLFPGAWKPSQDVKIKSHGLKALLDPSDAVTDPADKPPEPVVRSFEVVQAQPKLTAPAVLRLDDAMNILDGETKPLSITVRNMSTSTPVNFMHVTMDYEYDKETHTQRPTSTTAAFKNWIEPITWRSDDALQPVSPNGTATLDFNIQGQSGLQRATLRIDHGHLHTTDPPTDSSIHARRLRIPLTLSVHPSVRMENMQILAQPQLVAFDILNASSTLLHIGVSPSGQSAANPTEPSQSTRILLPLRTLSANSTKAFHATWTEPASGRNGSIRINPTRLATLLASAPTPPLVKFAMALLDNAGELLDRNAQKRYTVELEKSFTLRCTLRNASDSIQRAIVTLLPKIAGPAAELLSNEEIGKQLALTGSLKQGAKLEPGESKELKLGICPLSRGMFETVANVTLAKEKEVLLTEHCVFEVV